ncbi:MAG: hypothetical protein ACRD0K_01990 [Egibacteraceae bacterium]
MYETWKTAFERDGEVSIHGTRTHALLVALMGAAFVAVGALLLTVPFGNAFARLLPGLVTLAGVLSVLLGAVGVAVGARSARHPMLIARLNQHCLVPGLGCTIAWSEIEDVSLRRIGTVEHVEIRVSDAYAIRADRELRGWRARWWRTNRSWFGPGRVPLRTGAAGSGQDLQRLILWARAHVSTAG